MQKQQQQECLIYRNKIIRIVSFNNFIHIVQLTLFHVFTSIFSLSSHDWNCDNDERHSAITVFHFGIKPKRLPLNQ